jgi:hypothetical protein
MSSFPDKAQPVRKSSEAVAALGYLQLHIRQARSRFLHHATLSPASSCFAVQVYLTAGVTVGLVQGVMAQLPHTSKAQQH